MSTQPTSPPAATVTHPGVTQRVETLGHRMRTPLHTIMGYVGLLQANAQGEAYAQLGIIEASARQLLGMLDELPFATRMGAALAPMAAATPASGAAEPPPSLPADQLTTLRELLQLGRLLQIERWAADLMDRLPQHANAAHSIVTLARSANLPELEALLNQWTRQAVNKSTSGDTPASP